LIEFNKGLTIHFTNNNLNYIFCLFKIDLDLVAVWFDLMFRFAGKILFLPPPFKLLLVK